jgi:5-formyltetrahydrofolate cyclo-ligase
MMLELRARARKQIRQRMRSLRAAYPAPALAIRSERIVARLSELEAYRAARSVALFWPLAHEVDVRALDQAARAEGKSLFYPLMEPTATGYRTAFARVHDVSELAVRGGRFAEPPPAAPRAQSGELDFIVVPALAASANGHRLGYGVGFYDVTLPEFCPPAVSVVVVYDFQLLAELPSLDHDVSCQWIVTDARTLQG